MYTTSNGANAELKPPQRLPLYVRAEIRSEGVPFDSFALVKLRSWSPTDHLLDAIWQPVPRRYGLVLVDVVAIDLLVLGDVAFNCPLTSADVAVGRKPKDTPGSAQRNAIWVVDVPVVAERTCVDGAVCFNPGLVNRVDAMGDGESAIDLACPSGPVPEPCCAPGTHAIVVALRCRDILCAIEGFC